MYLPNHRLNLSGLTFLFILFSCSTFASEPYAIWVYPAWGPDATTLNYLDTINVSWKSNYPNPYLARWCESKPQVWTRCTSPKTELLPPSPKLNISTGTLPIKLDGGSMTQTCGPNVGCHLELHVPSDIATYDSNSDPLHVTSNAAAQPTTWSAQPSSTATSQTPTTQPATTASSSNTTAHPAPTNITTAPSPSTSSAPTTLFPPAKAGIALGAIFGSALLAFLTYRLRRQSRNAPSDLPELGKGSDSFSWQGSQQQMEVGELGGTWLRELEPDRTWVRELEGAPVGEEVERRGG
jgi:hypothetical protein